MSCDNAFLAVALDNGLKETLHETASAIAAAPAELLCVPGIGFTPHAFDKLHMTFVFCGEALHKLPKTDLCGLHSEIQNALLDADVQGHLEFKGFELFGNPNKKSMKQIIARFEAPESLQKLRDVVWRTCLAHDVGKADDDDWVAHVTLGEINATKAQAGAVSCRHVGAPSFAVSSLKPLGVTLLGARPKRAWLNWDDALLLNVALPERKAANEEAPNVSMERTGTDVDPIVSWLRAALRDELPIAEAEGLSTAVELILPRADASASDAKQALETVADLLREGGAPRTGDALCDRCTS